MNNDGDAIEGFIGLAVSGLFLLWLGASIDVEVGTNLMLFGGVFVLVAVFLGVLLIGSVVTSVLEGL